MYADKEIPSSSFRLHTFLGVFVVHSSFFTVNGDLDAF
jgi:hypothetical protein